MKQGICKKYHCSLMISGTWRPVCMLILWGPVYVVVWDSTDIWFTEAKTCCICCSRVQVEKCEDVCQRHKPLPFTVWGTQDRYIPNSTATASYVDWSGWLYYEVYCQDQRLFLLNAFLANLPICFAHLSIYHFCLKKTTDHCAVYLFRPGGCYSVG